MPKKPKDADANYDFRNKGDKRMPAMGDGSPSQLPQKAFIKQFPKSEDYRGGVCNNLAISVSDLSGIEENCPWEGYY